METIAATEASNRFGHLLDMARSEPVAIQKQGREVAIILAVEEYHRMENELEHLQNLRLAASISDMETGDTTPAEDVFSELKDRYSK